MRFRRAKPLKLLHTLRCSSRISGRLRLQATHCRLQCHLALAQARNLVLLGSYLLLEVLGRLACTPHRLGHGASQGN